MSILSRWYGKRTTALSIILMILILAAAGIYTAGFREAGARSSSIKYTVIIRHYGIDPEEMERSITISLEDRIAGIYGIKEMRSISELNTSRVDLTLLPGTDIREFYIELRDAVYSVYSSLPKSVQKPEIFSSAGDDRPILIVSLDSGEKDLNFLRDIAEEKLKPQLEKIEGVGEIEIGGGEPTEIHVVVNREKAQSMGLSARDIGRFIRLNYVKGGLGYVERFGKRTALVMDGRLNSLEELGNLEIPGSSGRLIRLSSIAKIKYGTRERDTISRVNGRKKVILYIKSAGTGNPLQVSAMVKKVLAKGDISYEIIYDYGERLKRALTKLLKAIAYAMVIVSLFLLIALRDFRKVSILSLSIPVTTAATVSLLTFLKIPVGIAVLSGLAIGIGLIADTGIIMVTAVGRRRGFMGSTGSSARRGRRVSGSVERTGQTCQVGRLRHEPNWKRVIELIPSLAASAATTVIAVVPLFFIPGNATGVRDIALVFILLIALSFILNVFFLPPLIGSPSQVHERRSLRDKRKSGLIPRWLLLRIFYYVEHFIVSKPPFGIISAMVLILLLGLSLIRVPHEVQRGVSEPVVFCHIEFDSGTNVKTIDSEMKKVVSGLLKIGGIEKVETLARRDNGSFSVRYNPDILSRRQAISAVEAYNNRLYNAFIYIPKAKNRQTSVEVGIVGPDDNYLREKGREAAVLFQRKPWVDKTVLFYKKGPPEWIFKVDNTRLSGLMLSTAQIVSALRWQLYGPVSIKWMENGVAGNGGGREIDLRVMGASRSGSANKIMNSRVINLRNETVPLREAGDFSLVTGRARIYRLNRQRAVFFGIDSRINDVDKLYAKIREGFDSLNLKSGYSYRIDPSLMEIRKEYVRLELMLILAVALIFMLIASQYESISAPIPVILSIPLSLSIPFIVLWLTGRVVTTSVFIGLIVVTGIVVNNTIILVDDILRRRERNKKEEVPRAIIHALRKRIIPMLLTSVSTLLGLIPLFLNRSASAELVHSLAFVVFWGVLGSVITSVVIMPALLIVFPGLTRRSFASIE